MNEQIKKYIDDARAHGISDADIKTNLLKAGWPQQDVEQAFGDTGTGVGAANVGRSRSMLWVGIVVAIIVILGGGYFVYAKVKNSPDKVWQQMQTQQALFNTKSVHIDQTVSVAAKQTNGEDLGFTLKSSADTDASKGVDNIASKMNLSLNISYQGFSFNVDGVELRMMGKVLYINISKVPYIGTYAKDYDGWVKIDTSTANSNAKPFDFSGLKDIFQQSNIIKSHTYEATETINGQKTYKYKVEVDKQALKTVIGTLLDKVVSQNADLQSSKTELDTAKGAISDIIDHLTLKNVEVWVNVKDRTLSRLVLNAEYSDTSKSDNIQGPVKIDYQADYSQYGESVSVQAPSKSVDIQSLMTNSLGLPGDVTGGAAGGTTLPATGTTGQ